MDVKGRLRLIHILKYFVEIRLTKYLYMQKVGHSDELKSQSKKCAYCMNPLMKCFKGKYTEMESRLLDGKVRLQEDGLTTERSYEGIFA